MTSKITEKDIHGGTWELFQVTPGFRRWRMEIEPGKWIIKTEHLEDELLVKHNKHLLDESQTKRFGDGQVVARIPLNKFYQDLGKGIKEGDKDHLKWWLNREENKPFRTFRGRV